MPTLGYFFMSATRGKSEKGDWFRISISVCEQTGDTERDFVCDFYVDAVMYANVQNIDKFTEVNCQFAPTASGRTRLMSIEPL